MGHFLADPIPHARQRAFHWLTDSRPSAWLEVVRGKPVFRVPRRVAPEEIDQYAGMHGERFEQSHLKLPWQAIGS